MLEEALARYWAKVDRRGPDECWPWKGSSVGPGYGQLHSGTKRRGRYLKVVATRLALAIDGRTRPSEDHVAMHRCDNPRCVNPKHLRWGTTAENMADMIAKGRSGAQIRAAAEMDRQAANLASRRGGVPKLDGATVQFIRGSTKSSAELARDLGVSSSLVSAVRQGTLYSEVP